jgi:hypothetical protein
MRLFDTPPSADIGPAKHGESHYDYLGRTGKPSFLRVRKLIEAWLAEFPKHHRQELTCRLRSRADHHFDGAFFELYLHTLFRGLGFSVRVHPRAGSRGKHPDFQLTGTGRRSLLLEAASVSERSDAARAEDARLRTVYDVLNRVNCPDYFLNVRHYGHLTSPVPGDQLRHILRQFLNSLDYQTVRDQANGGIRKLPKFSFSHGHFRLEIGVIPVSPRHRGDPDHRPLGMHGPGEAAWVDHHTPIRDKIRQKAHHYGALRRPLMLAINDVGGHADSVDVLEALFGTERFIFSPLSDRSSEPRFQRAPDGAWFGPTGPRNQKISAVFLVSALRPWTVAKAEPVIYCNPWARYPVESLPESIIQFRLEGQQMVPRGGSPVHRLLTLPQGWPHFEAA